MQTSVTQEKLKSLPRWLYHHLTFLSFKMRILKCTFSVALSLAAAEGMNSLCVGRFRWITREQSKMRFVSSANISENIKCVYSHTASSVRYIKSGGVSEWWECIRDMFPRCFFMSQPHSSRRKPRQQGDTRACTRYLLHCSSNAARQCLAVTKA